MQPGTTGKATECKNVEKALTESEDGFYNIVELAPDGIITIDQRGFIRTVNPAFCRLTGFSKEAIMGKHFTTLRTARMRDLPKFTKLFTSILKGEVSKPVEFQFKRKDGSIRWGEAHAGLLKRAGKVVGVQAIARDITERRQMEERLKESEARLSILFEFAPDAYYLNDLKGNFLDGNRAAEKLTGYRRDELIGQSFLKLKLLSRKQIPKAAKLLVGNALGKATGPDEFNLRQKDGTHVLVEIRTFPVKIKGKTQVLGIARDITTRKRAQEKLEKVNEKLSVVGKLTRHDARNKLSTAVMNIFLAKKKIPNDHEALRHLKESESALRQAEEVFDFARLYEKLGVEDLSYIDVEKTVGDAVKLISDLHGAKVLNECNHLTTLADSVLRRLFYNLIDNSLKYGETITKIRVFYEEISQDKLKLVYEDDGVGIPEAEKKKIFLEGYGKGTGYGLFLIRKICDVYGWSIKETGKYGTGAQFAITIPRLNEQGKPNYQLN